MDLTDEQVAVRASMEIENELGVQNSKILTVEEYEEEIGETPDWIDKDTDKFIIKTELYGDPEPPMIKTVSEILNETQTQVQYLKDDYKFYICPTKNTFPALAKIR